MADADHFFLARAEQRTLLLALRSIPALVADLAVTITRQDRIGEQVRIRARSLAEGSVMNLGAHEAAEDLHGVLVGWVRIVCEQRSVSLPEGLTATPAVARWLDGHIIALAMTEGAEVAYTDILGAVKRAEFHACPPAKTAARIDPQRLAEAEQWELNSNGIAAVASQLGEEYRNLTANRVANLARREHIKPVRWYREIPVYRLGDVLIEHLSVPIRRNA